MFLISIDVPHASSNYLRQTIQKMICYLSEYAAFSLWLPFKSNKIFWDFNVDRLEMKPILPIIYYRNIVIT